MQIMPELTFRFLQAVVISSQHHVPSPGVSSVTSLPTSLAGVKGLEGGQRAYIFTRQRTSTNRKKGTPRLRRHSSSEHSLPRSRRPKQQHPLRRFSKARKQIWSKKRVNNSFFQRLFSPFETSYVAPVNFIPLDYNFIGNLLQRCRVGCAAKGGYGGLETGFVGI
jgi:hypothetical protein